MRINLLLYLLLGHSLYNNENTGINAQSITPEALTPEPANFAEPIPAHTGAALRPNIVVVIADDFGPVEINSIHSQARLPTLRNLQRTGATINAQSTVHVCGPSRNAFLTGVRHPNTKTFDQIYQQLGYESIFKVLRDRANYYTVDIGKVMHFYGKDLKLSTLYANNETSAPNTCLRAGNSDCGAMLLGCTKPPAKTTDHAVTNKVIKEIQKCASIINKDHDKRCLIFAGLHHSHIQWIRYKAYSYQNTYPNVTTVAVNYDGKKYLLRHKSCDDFVNRVIGKRKIATSLTSVDQITGNRVLTTGINNLYLDALASVDYQVGRITTALNSQVLYDGSKLDANTVFIFMSDHGWSNGRENMFCKGAQIEEVRTVPFVVNWPGVTSGSRLKTRISLDDLFSTLLELGAGAKYAASYTHPSGIKPTGISFVPALYNKDMQIRDWVFSSVYRCQNPSITGMTSSCTSDRVDNSCDRPPITWVGHSATGILGSKECTYIGWWPFNEIRNCARIRYHAQPASLANIGFVSPQIDLFNSGTVFRNNRAAVNPIQQELICHDAHTLIGEGDHPNTINQINNPAYRSFVAQAKQQIEANNAVIGGEFPYRGRKITLGI